MAAYMRFSSQLVLAMPAPRLMLSLIARVIHVPCCVTTAAAHPRAIDLGDKAVSTGALAISFATVSTWLPFSIDTLHLMSLAGASGTAPRLRCLTRSKSSKGGTRLGGPVNRRFQK